MIGHVPVSLVVASASPLLQGAGGVSLEVLAIINVVLAVLVGYLTYRDAQGRATSSPALWAVALGLASLVLSFIGFLVAVGVYWFVVVRS